MEIIKPNEMTYGEFKSRQYPGYKLRGSRDLDRKLANLEKKMTADKDYLDRMIKKYGNTSKEAIKAQGYYDTSLKEYETTKKALDSGDAFADQSVEYRPYIPSEPDFSLGEYVGRQMIEANRAKLVVDHYNDTYTAEALGENDEATIKPLTDCLSVLDTDSEEAIFFNDILGIGAGAYEDNKEVITDAFDAAHNRHIINAENKKALEILIAKKTAVTVAADGIQSAINSKLCGKAKRNAIIIVNKTGFAKLDIEVDGVSQVTRDASGNMVYKNKYIIQEMPTEILPDKDGSSPCIIGDIRNVLKFFLIRDDVLFKDNIFPATVADRRIKKEIITRTANTDEAYFVGNLS